MAEDEKGRPGPPTKYPDKVRMPVSIQLDAPRLEQMQADLQRLAAAGCKVKRGDYICRLIELHGAELQPW